jgi:hypothetical protein
MVAPTVVDPKVTIFDVVTDYREEINQKLVWSANEVTKKPVFSDRYSIKPVDLEQVSPPVLHALRFGNHNGFLSPRKLIAQHEQQLPEHQRASDKKIS